MRAPLRAIQSFGQILSEDAKSRLIEKDTAILSKMVSAAGRLDRLIQEVLVYTRLSKQELTPAVIEVGEMVNDLIDERPEFQPPAADVRFKGTSLKIVAHDASFAQCVGNLLHNAVKFVPKDRTPVVRVTTERHDNMVRVIIEDNGIGIDEAGQRRLFQMFQRIVSPGDYDGTGVGLALVRKAAERMNGRAGVQSHVGKGSRFWLELPVAQI
jgi:signal transduction histidine kinase